MLISNIMNRISIKYHYISLFFCSSIKSIQKETLINYNTENLICPKLLSRLKSELRYLSLSSFLESPTPSKVWLLPSLHSPPNIAFLGYLRPRFTISRSITNHRLQSLILSQCHQFPCQCWWDKHIYDLIFNKISSTNQNSGDGPRMSLLMLDSVKTALMPVDVNERCPYS